MTFAVGDVATEAFGDGHVSDVAGGRRFLRRFVHNRAAMASLTTLVLLVLLAIFGPTIAPYEPNEQNLQLRLADPFTGGHVLGTDELGRDTLSRMIVAGRIALQAAVQAVLVAIGLGVPPGLIAGYFSGRTDLVIMRVNDAVQSFPPLILAIALVGVLGPSLRNAMIAIGIVFAPQFLRIVRGSVLEVREMTFVAASRSIGTPTTRIIRSRILPNVMSPLLVQTSLAAGFALLAEASLSFLGLGAAPPDASWGSMLNRGYQYFSQQPWLILFPGLAITVVVLAFNVLGDGIRDSIGREVRRER